MSCVLSPLSIVSRVIRNSGEEGIVRSNHNPSTAVVGLKQYTLVVVVSRRTNLLSGEAITIEESIRTDGFSLCRDG